MLDQRSLDKEWKPATVVFFSEAEREILLAEAQEETDGSLKELVRQRALKGVWREVKP